MTYKIIEIELGTYDSRFAISLAFAAYRRNSGYVKQSKLENGIWRYSNKELILYTISQIKNMTAPPDSVQKNWIPENFEHLEITDEDCEDADAAIKFFKRYTLDAMTDDFSSFKKDVLAIVTDGGVTLSKMGIVGYIPELYERENQDVRLRRRLKQEFSESQFYTGKVSGTVEILRSINIVRFGKFAHLGAIDGNLVSFMLDHELPVGEKFKITAKFTAKDQCQYTGVPKSRINYVKLKKV